MAYKTPDYTKISETDGMGMEFYAPSMVVVVIVIAAMVITGCDPPD